MPDREWTTVSASQVPALFGQSPYMTRWMLWHAFRARDLSMIEPAENERMWWGKMLQPIILAATAREFKLDIVENVANQYRQRGSVGATIDGLTSAPDLGPIVVEAKGIDWLRWRDTWTATAAAPHVEIQTQINMWAAGAEHGIIAACVGGNSPIFHRRELNRELIERCEEEARLFLESVRDGKEPDPLGSPLELPMMAQLYPVINPIEVVEDLEDKELPRIIREFDRARREHGAYGRLQDQMKALILGKAKTAGILKAAGVTCYLQRSTVASGICKPHAEDKVIRKGYSVVNIDVTVHDPEWSPSIREFFEGAVNA